MNNKVYSLCLSKNTDGLQKLIAEHPNYPIVVLAGECANSGDYSWMCCSEIRFGIEEILEAEVPYSEMIETDRDNFTEQMENWLWNELGQNDKGAEKMPKTEFQAKLNETLAEFEPYWQKVIAVYADN